MNSTYKKQVKQPVVRRLFQETVDKLENQASPNSTKDSGERALKLSKVSSASVKGWWSSPSSSPSPPFATHSTSSLDEEMIAAERAVTSILKKSLAMVDEAMETGVKPTCLSDKHFEECLRFRRAFPERFKSNVNCSQKKN